MAGAWVWGKSVEIHSELDLKVWMLWHCSIHLWHDVHFFFFFGHGVHFVGNWLGKCSWITSLKYMIYAFWPLSQMNILKNQGSCVAHWTVYPLFFHAAWVQQSLPSSTPRTHARWHIEIIILTAVYFSWCDYYFRILFPLLDIVRLSERQNINTK